MRNGKSVLTHLAIFQRERTIQPSLTETPAFNSGKKGVQSSIPDCMCDFYAEPIAINSFSVNTNTAAASGTLFVPTTSCEVGKLHIFVLRRIKGECIKAIGKAPEARAAALDLSTPYNNQVLPPHLSAGPKKCFEEFPPVRKLPRIRIDSLKKGLPFTSRLASGGGCGAQGCSHFFDASHTSTFSTKTPKSC
mmetsp:Transcript_55300/g.111022  ORF Transcript_55300/g.111022 Transcript_55300/m.111022 type:complete len:192 (+) Transcript_55300:134-709(+)